MPRKEKDDATTRTLEALCSIERALWDLANVPAATDLSDLARHTESTLEKAIQEYPQMWNEDLREGDRPIYRCANAQSILPDGWCDFWTVNEVRVCDACLKRAQANRAA